MVNCSTFLPSSFENRGERLRRVRALGLDRPVLRGAGRPDLLLALDDHAQRRRLHAAGGQAALHLAPQHRREIEADQVVQRAPRLRVHQRHRIWRGRSIARGWRAADLREFTRCSGFVEQFPQVLEDLGDAS